MCVCVLEYIYSMLRVCVLVHVLNKLMAPMLGKCEAVEHNNERSICVCLRCGGEWWWWWGGSVRMGGVGLWWWLECTVVVWVEDLGINVCVCWWWRWLLLMRFLAAIDEQGMVVTMSKQWEVTKVFCKMKEVMKWVIPPAKPERWQQQQ